MSSSIPVLLVMLFANVGKRSNSRWQMFFKTGVLKNIHRKTTGKHLCWSLPNGHTTSNPRRFDVDIASMRRRPNFDESPSHFHVLFRRNFAGRKIHVVFKYFFRCNFDGQKIYVVSTYFFRCNFAVQKIHFISTHFSWHNFTGQNIYVFSTYSFRCNLSGRGIHVVFTRDSSLIFLFPLTFFV